MAAALSGLSTEKNKRRHAEENFVSILQGGEVWKKILLLYTSVILIELHLAREFSGQDSKHLVIIE